MKKTILSFVIILTAATLASSQTLVTPTAGPQKATNSESSTTYHYVIDLATIQSFAATSGDVLLFTTVSTSPSIIDSVIIGPTTAVTGGALSAVTAQVKTGNSYGSAKSVFTATGNTIQYVINTSGYVEGTSTAVNLHLIATGANLSAATAGKIDVWIARRQLR